LIQKISDEFSLSLNYKTIWCIKIIGVIVNKYSILSFVFGIFLISTGCDAVKVTSRETHEDFLGSGQSVQVIRRSDDLKLFGTFNDMGKIYDSGYAAIEPLFIAYLNKLERGNILEIGAGNGHTLKALRSSKPKGPIRYVLNEIDPLSQDYLKNNFPQIDGAVVTPVLSKARALEHLRKNDRPYDAIYSAMVFHFFDPVEYLDTLLECHRNLKPGGKLFMLQNSYVFRANDPGMIDFQINKAEGSLFPGYFTSLRAAGINWYDSHTTMTRGKSNDEIAKGMMNPEKYLLLNFHNQESLAHLLQMCGFEVELSRNFFEKYPDRSAVSYVGMMAKKGNAPLTDDQITALRNRAQVQKRHAEQNYVAPYSTLEDGVTFQRFRMPFIVDMAKL